MSGYGGSGGGGGGTGSASGGGGGPGRTPPKADPKADMKTGGGSGGGNNSNSHALVVAKKPGDSKAADSKDGSSSKHMIQKSGVQRSGPDAAAQSALDAEEEAIERRKKPIGANNPAYQAMVAYRKEMELERAGANKMTISKVVKAKNSIEASRFEIDKNFPDMYPYNHGDVKTLPAYISTLEKLYYIKDMLEERKIATSPFTQDAISTALQLLQDSEKVSFPGKLFCDLFSCTGEAALFAAAFPFSELIAIAPNEETYTVMKRIAYETPWIGYHRCVYRVGSMQSYFPNDAVTLFADTTQLLYSCLDEGQIVRLAMELSKDVCPGTYFILLTNASEMSHLTFAPYRWHTLVNSHIVKPEGSCHMFILKS